jgi:hypothetical protein
VAQDDLAGPAIDGRRAGCCCTECTDVDANDAPGKASSNDDKMLQMLLSIITGVVTFLVFTWCASITAVAEESPPRKPICLYLNKHPPHSLKCAKPVAWRPSDAELADVIAQHAEWLKRSEAEGNLESWRECKWLPSSEPCERRGETTR